MAHAKGFVYAFFVGDLVKIGYTNRIQGRITTLLASRTLWPERSRIALNGPRTNFWLCFVKGTFKTEHNIHKLLEEQRYSGEWFWRSHFTLDLLNSLGFKQYQPAVSANLTISIPKNLYLSLRVQCQEESKHYETVITQAIGEYIAKHSPKNGNPKKEN